ncbi:hypothetical protein [Nitrosomonas ureae]|uniref:AAA ATPase domain-containing protein n=1 Tax=Nitrosomonas ureae TaxID=44577 RepID=A0A1H2EIV2_9PROT|nr:hypothetical protein [Nitrosomonas ureae]ALQ50316.1 hypothetical protein ATY38_03145 [Nitrosomonas ureae]SDT95037.1 hypothetical protein SAMN05216406_11317 [Nitrosomonas ureae]
MNKNDNLLPQLKAFHNTLQNSLPLEFDSPLYVPILQQNPASDPILQLSHRIDFAESESVNLLTGFRGNGKSTELRRLKHLLENQGHIVILTNMQQYVLMTKPLELGDFLLSLIAALADRAVSDHSIGILADSPLARLWSFLTETKIEIEKAEVEGNLGVATAKIGARLQRDANFKKQVQEKLRGNLDGLVQKAHLYIRDLVNALKKGNTDKKIVLLVDSLEQIRGVGDDAQSVYDSIVELFSGQAANLALPGLHVVYTVPPFLIPRAPNIARNLGANPICIWPNIHVRNKKGEEDHSGLEIMQEIIQRRYSEWLKFYTQKQLFRLASLSGGDIRDYFRLVCEGLLGLSAARSVNQQPKPEIVNDDMLNRAIVQLTNEFQPIPESDKQQLKKIHHSKQHALDGMDDLPTLTRFLDANMIMNYVNGEPWYDVHPVLVKLLLQ